ncbi:shikimate dehydrogenase [Herbiconiux solani]|uniref:shikimate dehydrogenase n=1 Tax=Herbiconiux solani TaxID=661329 RepID=UPI0008261D5E|nr:shikimate dehydrogenase [Herbiconiux solani]
MTIDPLTGDPDALRVPRLLGVLGSPIAHSKSPLLHRAAYAALGLPWGYDAIEVTSEQLPGFLAELDEPWRGLSLTMPLKETVFGSLSSVDAVGRMTESVNTVLVTSADGRRLLSGFNTDVYGIAEALREAGVTSTARTLVLGGGATARSAVVAAAQLGSEHVDVVLRSPAKAASVVEAARAAGVASSVTALHDPALAGLEPDLTISTLPGGVGVSVNFAAAVAPRSSTLLDVAYHPWPSELAGLWQQAGSATVTGEAMLVHQALMQIRIFLHGDPLVKLPDEPRILAAMQSALAPAS